MFLAEVADISSLVAATPSRKKKIAILADAVAALEGHELPIGVAYLSGVIPQGPTGIGYATVETLPDPAGEATLTLSAVDRALTSIAMLAGPGSGASRGEEVRRLFASATQPEQSFLQALIVGGLRHGAGESLMADAIARTSGIPASRLRRAAMFTGDIGEVAVAAIESGPEAIAGIGLRLFRPVVPMLAKTAATVADAIELLGRGAVERKLDGARIQAHAEDGRVRVFTRNLNDVTDRLPEVVAAVAALGVSSVVLDGEAIALRDDGAPYPFQETMARFGSEAAAGGPALHAFFFDVLHLDGEDVLDLGTEQRFAIIDRIVPGSYRVPRLVTDDAEQAQDFFAETIAGGHEGVMVKALDAPYAAGRRGAAWLKVKPVYTLDLVVLAVEWGSGRRHGWLSNIHLGARDREDGFVMLGKTFKGMTDEILAWQTERFLDLETHRKGRVVYVRPEQVVEVACDGIQASTRYPGGVALRFARVKGYRHDKPAADADTIDTVRAMFADRNG